MRWMKAICAGGGVGQRHLGQMLVLVGDFLFSRCFELMVEDGSLEVLAILAHTTSVLAEGEVLQLITANDTDTDEDAYLNVIRLKTAILFGAAAVSARWWPPGQRSRKRRWSSTGTIWASPFN